jgi:hypothetical protein
MAVKKNDGRHPGIPTHCVDHTGRALIKAQEHRASRKRSKLELKKIASQEA